MFRYLNSNISVALVALCAALIFTYGATRQQAVRAQDGIQKVTIDWPKSGVNLIGTNKATVAVIEYGDNQCPYCLKAYQETEPALIQAAYKGKLLFVSREFPLAMHKAARTSAMAALCAGDQDPRAYWFLRGLMREKQKDLTGVNIDRWIKADGRLDPKLWNNCMAAALYAKQVTDDIAAGTKAGVKATPTFIVGSKVGKKLNGELFVGDLEAVTKALKRYGVELTPKETEQ